MKPHTDFVDAMCSISCWKNN